MKSQIVPQPKAFQPVVVTLTIESEYEFTLWQMLTTSEHSYKAVQALPLTKKGQDALSIMLSQLYQTLDEAK